MKNIKSNKSLLLLILLLFSLHLSADYISDRQKGMNMIYAGNYQEALSLFSIMSQGNVNDYQKSDALDLASHCANKLADYKLAMKLAKQIPMKAISDTACMKTLFNCRKFKELVTDYSNAPISSWPERVKGNAFRLRGRAYFYIKDADNAEKDLKLAAKFLHNIKSKADALNSLGDIYVHLLKDDDQALFYYQQARNSRRIYSKLRATIAISAILLRQHHYDKALKILSEIDPQKLACNYWLANLLRAQAKALTAKGLTTNAILKYKAALAIKEMSSDDKKACRQELEKLTSKPDENK